MSQPPSTPAKVPASAAAYTPATLDPAMRSQINSLLIHDGHVAKLSDHLLHNLNADPSNWPSLIQQHALALLRSGEVSTFPALIQRVLGDIRHDTAAATTNTEGTNGKADESNTNGTTNGDSADKKAANGTSTGSGTNGSNLAIPPAVVEAMLKKVKESLDEVVEPHDSSGGGSN